MLKAGILALRKRSVWEAADAGLLLWKRNLGYFIPFFAIPFWICAFALRLSPGLMSPENYETFYDSVYDNPLSGGVGYFLSGSGESFLIWSWIILWWLSPLFDRFILHVAAKRFFEPQASLSALFRGLGRNLGRGLVGDLLWRRLSPWRAAMLPLRLLEWESRGNRRRIKMRKRALANGGLHFCIFLTMWCSILQWILLAGETFFVLMIARLFFNPDLSSFGNIFAGKGLYYYTGWCVNFLVVESVYVCMGFGLYLNSRVEVEGWDIELLFRNFAARRAGAGGQGTI
ncbi:MAG: glucose-6-phosphate dehydrogenase assembly protein OpcA [Treponema sp.]|jgi:hypothetical protein|nr:glucose-6-phosphate dehydrogenase assembly protein OpcA [Treponema sp.]